MPLPEHLFRQWVRDRHDYPEHAEEIRKAFEKRAQLEAKGQDAKGVATTRDIVGESAYRKKGRNNNGRSNDDDSRDSVDRIRSAEATQQLIRSLLTMIIAATGTTLAVVNPIRILTVGKEGEEVARTSARIDPKSQPSTLDGATMATEAVAAEEALQRGASSLASAKAVLLVEGTATTGQQQQWWWRRWWERKVVVVGASVVAVAATVVVEEVSQRIRPIDAEAAEVTQATEGEAKNFVEEEASIVVATSELLSLIPFDQLSLLACFHLHSHTICHGHSCSLARKAIQQRIASPHAPSVINTFFSSACARVCVYVRNRKFAPLSGSIKQSVLATREVGNPGRAATFKNPLTLP